MPIILEVTGKKSVPEERKIQPGCVSISRIKILLADLLLSGDNSELLGLKESHRHCQTHVGITSLYRAQGVTSIWNNSPSQECSKHQLWLEFKELHSTDSACFNQNLMDTILLRTNHSPSTAWWKMFLSCCTRWLRVIMFTPTSLFHFLTVGISVPCSFERQTEKSFATSLTKNIFGKHTAVTWSVRKSKASWAVQQTYLKKSKEMSTKPLQDRKNLL